MNLRTLPPLVVLCAVAACQADPCGAAVGDLCRLAGTGEFGFNRDGLSPTETDLYLPSAARRGPDGLLYIMDFNNQRVRRVGADGLVETYVGNGFHAIATTGVPTTQTPLENPIDFRFFSDGRLVFVSYHDPRVLVVSEAGTLETIAGAADGVVGTEGDEGDGGPAIDALFIQLDGIAVTADDTIYVSDSLANRVRKIEDGTITTIVGTGDIEYAGDGGPAIDASLHWPTALELDPDGGLLIADTFHHVVRRLGPDGIIETVVGTGLEGYSGDGGSADEARLREPYGLALDTDGTLYIGDRGNFVIRRVDSEGIITTVAGTGKEGFGGDGQASESSLGYSARLAIDDDDLLITDQSNATVLRMRLR